MTKLLKLSPDTKETLIRIKQAQDILPQEAISISNLTSPQHLRRIRPKLGHNWMAAKTFEDSRKLTKPKARQPTTTELTKSYNLSSQSLEQLPT